MKNSKELTAVVVGASGVIGSAFAVTLLEKYKLKLISPRSTAIDWEINNDTIKRIDVSLDQPLPDHIFKNVDLIVNCSTPNDQFEGGVGEQIKASVVRISNIFDAIDRSRKPALIHLSTAQVYGSELKNNVNEFTLTAPKNSYGLAHLAAEFVIKERGIDELSTFLIVRPSNVFDEFFSKTITRETLVPYCFVREAVSLKKITLNSSGDQIRNFVLATDLANKALQLLDRKINDSVNIGSNSTMSIYQMATLVAERTAQIFGESCEVVRPPNDNSKVDVDTLEFGSEFDGIIVSDNLKDRFSNTLDKMITYRMSTVTQA